MFDMGKFMVSFRSLALLAVAVNVSIALSANTAFSETIAIIVNRDNPVESVTEQDLKKFYSDISVKWSTGERVKIYDLPINNEARKIFSAKILQRSPEDVTMEWANKRITNTAKNPPNTLKSQVLMQSKVASEKGGLGYMFADKVNHKKVKVVLTIKE